MNIRYVDEKGRIHTSADVYKDRAVVIRAGVRTRYLKRLRVGEQFEHDPPFVIPPGGMLAIDITPPGYWGSEDLTDSPVPKWAPAKLATLSYARIGPYVIAGHSDPNGNGSGGQGVTPYWFDYRNCEEGRRAAATEMLGMINRTPIDYASPIDPNRYSLATATPPLGYAVDLNLARRWDPDCMEYLRFLRHDGQHLLRGYRAALALRRFHDGLGSMFLQLYLKHTKLAWGPKEIEPTENRAYWGVDQWLASGKCREGLGREWAHVFRLAATLDPKGPFVESLVKMLHQGNREGVPFYLSPTTAPWARIEGGGIFGEDEPIAMTREWMLAGEALGQLDELASIRRQMVDFHGTRPAGSMNGEGTGYGNPNADYELFYNDLQRYDGKPSEVLRVSSTRHPESAAMPMDSWPRRYWKDYI